MNRHDNTKKHVIMGLFDCDLTRDLLNLVGTLSEKIGQTNAQFQNLPDFRTKRKYRVDTLHAVMNMDTGGPTWKAIAATMDSRWVMEPEKNLREIYNTINLYNKMHSLNPWNLKSFRSANEILTHGLRQSPGAFRQGITFYGNRLSLNHLPPENEEIQKLLDELFEFLNKPGEHLLIKAAIAQFNIIYCQPFEYGNRVISLFWHTLILVQGYSAFEFIPYETMLLQTWRDFGRAFRDSLYKDNPTQFVHYMLKQLNNAISNYLDHCRYSRGPDQRLIYFRNLNPDTFTRKDYMRVFKYISPSTASNDLAMGVQSGLFIKRGMNNQTEYTCRIP